MAWQQVEHAPRGGVAPQPLRALSRRGEPLAPLALQPLDRGDELLLRAAGAGNGVREPSDPRVVVAHAEQHEPRAVAADVGGDARAHRRRRHQRQSANEDPGDEDAPDAPVAVGEGVDDLELRVRDRRLADRVDVVAVDVGDEVVDERGHLLGWRRDEMGVERRRSADPPLLGRGRRRRAARRRASGHERPMPPAQALDGEGSGVRLLDRLGDRREVGGDPRGGRRCSARRRPRRGRCRRPARSRPR